VPRPSTAPSSDAARRTSASAVSRSRADMAGWAGLCWLGPSRLPPATRLLVLFTRSGAACGSVRVRAGDKADKTTRTLEPSRLKSFFITSTTSIQICEFSEEILSL
jgi:hypothetical protein